MPKFHLRLKKCLKKYFASRTVPDCPEYHYAYPWGTRNTISKYLDPLWLHEKIFFVGAHFFQGPPSRQWYRGDKNKNPPLKVRKLPIFWRSEGGFYFFPKSIFRKSPWVFIFFQIPEKKFGGFLFFSKFKIHKKVGFERFCLGIPPKIFRRAFGAHFLFNFALVYPQNFPARLRRAFFCSISPW